MRSLKSSWGRGEGDSPVSAELDDLELASLLRAPLAAVPAPVHLGW